MEKGVGMSRLSLVTGANNGNNGTSKCDMVAEAVLARILNGEYKVGERLPPENHLADEFHVSRATIREAFKKLNMLNVVSIRQGDGTFVERVDPGLLFRPLFSTLLFEHTNIRQLYEVRIWIEVFAMTIAVKKMTPEHLRELRKIVLDIDGALRNDDTRLYSELDHKLHSYIFAMTDNFALQSIYAMMRDILRLYRTRSLKTIMQMRISNKRHHSIIEALENGDDQVAIELMRRHIEVCYDQLIESIDGINDSGNDDDGD